MSNQDEDESVMGNNQYEGGSAVEPVKKSVGTLNKSTPNGVPRSMAGTMTANKLNAKLPPVTAGSKSRTAAGKSNTQDGVGPMGGSAAGTRQVSKNKSANLGGNNEMDQIPTMRTGGGLNSKNKSPSKNIGYNLANQ